MADSSSSSSLASLAAQLRVACASRKWDEVVRLAQQVMAGDDKSALDEKLSPDGWRALHFCAAGGSSEAVAALVAAGADVSAIAKAGSTALHLACWEGREETVKTLIDSGATVDATTGAGRTPLHFAAHRGHSHIIRRLIASGADADAKEKDGRSPLHFAAREGYTHVIRGLVEAGADTSATDAKGDSPADIARKSGFPDVVSTATGNTPNNQPTNPEPLQRVGVAGKGWRRSLSRTASDLSSMFSKARPLVDEDGNPIAYDDTHISRGEMYAVVGAGVLVSALIPVVRSAVREG